MSLLRVAWKCREPLTVNVTCVVDHLDDALVRVLHERRCVEVRESDPRARAPVLDREVEHRGLGRAVTREARSSSATDRPEMCARRTLQLGWRSGEATLGRGDRGRGTAWSRDGARLAFTGEDAVGSRGATAASAT